MIILKTSVLTILKGKRICREFFSDTKKSDMSSKPNKRESKRKLSDYDWEGLWVSSYVVVTDFFPGTLFRDRYRGNQLF